jgi:hypothetical protein
MQVHTYQHAMPHLGTYAKLRFSASLERSGVTSFQIQLGAGSQKLKHALLLNAFVKKGPVMRTGR